VRGTFTWRGGDIYIGEWMNDLQHGRYNLGYSRLFSWLFPSLPADKKNSAGNIFIRMVESTRAIGNVDISMEKVHEFSACEIARCHTHTLSLSL
jgi:hypothetical protein